jgi:phosphoketolase
MGGPKIIDDKKIEGNNFSHQVIFEDVAKNSGHLDALKS